MIEIEENTVDDPSAQPESSREKASLVVVGLLAVILAPVIILTSFFSNNVTSENYSIDQQKEIKILVVIKAKEFLAYSTKNVCDGAGEISGLYSSEVQLRTDTWIRKASLGQGTLNSDGACEYRISVTPPSDFGGGEVIASTVLPLGKTKDATGDTGNGTSFKLITLTYNLG